MAGVRHALSMSAVGGPATLRRRLGEIAARYQPDELIVAGMIFDGGARLRSLRLVMEAAQGLPVAQAA